VASCLSEGLSGINRHSRKSTSSREHSVLKDPSKSARFEQLLIPHLNTAFSLARWLTRDESRAQDVVQEAYLRAFSSFDSLRGADPRPWLLSIVRNVCYTLLRRQNASGSSTPFNEEFHEAPAEDCNPEELQLRSANLEVLRQALAQLPTEFREALILREFEDLSYKQISEVTGVPIGTIMSRLARARQKLQTILLEKREAGVI
jgi:RNA polymerase sigma-70 factor (ECF subfamily)